MMGQGGMGMPQPGGMGMGMPRGPAMAGGMGWGGGGPMWRGGMGMGMGGQGGMGGMGMPGYNPAMTSYGGGMGYAPTGGMGMSVYSGMGGGESHDILDDLLNPDVSPTSPTPPRASGPASGSASGVRRVPSRGSMKSAQSSRSTAVYKQGTPDMDAFASSKRR